jgi:hypothetical protein
MHAMIIVFFNKVLLEKCYKEENVEETRVATASCLKRITQ